MANQFLVAISAGALVVALIAMLVGAVCRAASPSVRNLVWNSALIACVAAPVAWMLGKPLTIQVPSRLLQSFSSAPSTRIHDAQDAENPRATPSIVVARVSTPLGDSGRGDLSKAFLLIWISGVAFLGVRFARQLLLAGSLVRHSTRSTHPDLDRVLRDATMSLGLRQRVTVLESAEIDIPLATGILRPAVLLPTYSREWTNQELQVVLLHELAHIKRGDVLARVAAMAACGVHWFNPMVWLLNNLAARDAELAADDLVLRAGVRPSSYADTLLDLADSFFRFPDVQPAMTLAGRALLADRVHAILRESHSRAEIGEFTRSMVLIAGCAIAMLTACVRLSARADSPPGAPATSGHQDLTVANLLGDRQSASPLPTTNQAPSAGPLARVTRAELAPQIDSTWVGGATDGLIHALQDSSPQVRGEAAHSLGRLRATRAQAALSLLLNDPNKFVQYEALQALSELERAR